MKISKRSNGSFVLRVNQVEATISGSQSIKEVYELYEKLIRLVGDGKELKKIEASVIPSEAIESKKVENVAEGKKEKRPVWVEPPLSRPALILSLLEKQGAMTVPQMRDFAKIENDDTKSWHGAISYLKRSKKVKWKKDKDGLFVYTKA